MNCWVSGSIWLNQFTNSEWDTTGRIDKIQRQTEATKNKTNKQESKPWMAYLASSLPLLLVPTLQSITTSSESSLLTRWRGSSPLSPSPSLEQKRRVATSPSPCEYCTASHQPHFTSHLHIYAQCTQCLKHTICSWAFNSLKKRQQVRETSWHTWKQLELLHEREL